jgi:3'-phosphoadenosine 5'-phosphosulfate sulfotransferase (PAPS reductase)/FAD synthetase
VISYVIFASGGNDSVALVQWAKDNGLENVAVGYSDTGWAASEWPARIERFKVWVQSLGYEFHTIESEGMEALIRRKKAFPANRPKFCTYELKILPAKKWLDSIDPPSEAVCMVGVRREESAARQAWPEYVESSENHGGRSLWAPLATMVDDSRNDLITKAGWEVLPHRSKECSPCVNANRTDFRNLGLIEIEKVRKNESEMNRTMFRPHRFHGAVGIDEVMRWAWSDRGKYAAENSGCDSGMCGT